MKIPVLLILLTVSPFLWLLTRVSAIGSPLSAFANISGFVGAVFMIWEFLLGIRGIAQVIFRNIAPPLKLHQFLGVYGMFFILIHPISEMFSYGEKVVFLFRPDFSSGFEINITLGRVALVLLLFVFVTSALVREKLSRRVWLCIHVSSYATMGFVFIHALDIGTFLRMFPLIRAYWFFLMAAYVGILVWRGWLYFRPKALNVPVTTGKEGEGKTV